MSETTVDVAGDRFKINGRYTYPGRVFRGHRIEGLLLNARFVQAIFDDLNPGTRQMFAYADGAWDAERNVSEFLAALPDYQAYGLNAFTVNLQGGSPQGYSKEQPWHNSGFDSEGNLRADYTSRLARVIGKADDLGMVVILGLFYFGQDQRLEDENAVIAAVENASNWVVEQGYKNVLIEIGNEIDVPRYHHEIIEPGRCHELIEVAQKASEGRVDNAVGRLYVGTSYRGGSIPGPDVVAVSDVLYLHGNHVEQPDEIRAMVQKTKAVDSYRGQPIVFNEDDHFDFEQDDNNFLAAVSEGASWGLFDYRFAGEGPENGFQSVPVDWRISSPRKQAFFDLVAQMSGQ